MKETREFFYPTGRKDKDGVEWFRTDGYNGWYRWEGGNLITEANPVWS